MAKDGTMRGGARLSSGPKKKALVEKIAQGSTATILKSSKMPDLQSIDMPAIKDYLKEEQKNGFNLCAEEIFIETWKWIKKMGCSEYVNTQLVNQYAMSVARQIQCEHAISQLGFLAKHPTTGNPIASPYVSMLQQFTKQANQSWYQIYQIVKENSSVEYTGTIAEDDTMEKLLRAKKGN